MLLVYSNDSKSDEIIRQEQIMEIEYFNKIDDFYFEKIVKNDTIPDFESYYIVNLICIAFNGNEFDFNLIWRTRDSPTIAIDCNDNSYGEKITIITSVTKNEISISNITDGSTKPTVEKYLGGLILDLVDNSNHIDDRLEKSNRILFNIKFNNMFNYGLQFKLAKLLICNLIHPGITFGPTVFNYTKKDVDRLNIFQNTAMRQALTMDRQTSACFLQVLLGVCDIQSWIDYSKLINYFRIKMIIIGSALNKSFEGIASYFNSLYGISDDCNVAVLFNTNLIGEELIDSVPTEYFLLLNKYDSLQYWNLKELKAFGTKVEWKTMSKDIVLTMAWDRDWNSIKHNRKLKIFYKSYFQAFKKLKPFTVLPIFDEISKLKDVNGIRWLLRILAGVSPFDNTRKTIIYDYFQRETVSKYESNPTWNPKSDAVLNRYTKNNDGVIHHGCFNLNTNQDIQLNIKQQKMNDFDNGDYIVVEKKVYVKVYECCLWCNKKCENVIIHIFNHCTKFNKYQLQYALKNVLTNNINCDLAVLKNLVLFLEFSMSNTLRGKFLK